MTDLLEELLRGTVPEQEEETDLSSVAGPTHALLPRPGKGEVGEETASPPKQDGKAIPPISGERMPAEHLTPKTGKTFFRAFAPWITNRYRRNKTEEKGKPGLPERKNAPSPLAEGQPRLTREGSDLSRLEESVSSHSVQITHHPWTAEKQTPLWERSPLPAGKADHSTATGFYRELARLHRAARYRREESVAPPPLPTPDQREAQGDHFSAARLDRVFQRDARRYDGGFSWL